MKSFIKNKFLYQKIIFVTGNEGKRIELQKFMGDSFIIDSIKINCNNNLI